MNIDEGNKLIAEFKGAIWKPDDYGEHGYFFPDNSRRPSAVEALKYHSSWDWLHPVVKKCFNLNGDSGFGLFDAADFYQDNIMNVWKSVTKFIQWYNDQKNDPYPSYS